MPPKRPASPIQASAEQPKTYISEPIHDRNSVFIGYYSPGTTKPKEVQQREDVRSASHRILAWRLPSSQKTLLPNAAPVLKTGHDDDGENWAGQKIEKVMEELNLQGVIMVARWYGGELLGPARFRHIEAVSKGAVDAWRSDSSSGDSKRARLDSTSGVSPLTPSSQTMAPDELARRKKQAIETLKRRDESITTLRALLEQKKRARQPESASAQPPSSSASPARMPDYAQMPFARLQALEGARDNTISFLLKSIDKAEADLKKQQDEERMRKESAKALKEVRDADELEEAWAEMEEAMKESEKVQTPEK
jgi:hypothetical protein